MKEWSVSISARGDGRSPILDEEASALAAALDRYFGTVGHTPDRISATLTVRTKDAHDALERGRVIFQKATRKTVAATVIIDELEAIEHGRLAELLANPTAPELVGVQEAAAIVGVSKQRILDLAKTSKRFPRPVASLASGRIWVRSAIESFSRTRPGKPGRPVHHRRVG